MSNREWENSQVMSEFMKIAAESGLITTDLNPKKKDFVGNPSEPTPVKDHRRYEPGPEYGVTKEEGKDLVEKAHPKTSVMADAMGAGGVVENLVEQQEKDIEIATKMPTGALYGVHAELVKNLVAKANKFEEEGKVKEAARIDETLRRITELPFSNGHLVKVAWIPQLIGLALTVAPFAFSLFGRGGTVQKGRGYKRVTKGPARPLGKGGKIMALMAGAFTLLSAFGAKMTSRKEDLKTDLKDLHDALIKAKSRSDNAKSAAMLLKPFISKLAKPMDDKGFKRFFKDFKKLEAVMPKVDKYIAKASIELGPGRWYQFGFDVMSGIKAKYDDLDAVVKETRALVNRAEGLGKKMDVTARKAMEEKPVVVENSVERLQKMLFTDPGKITGKMDMTTITAAARLEENIDDALDKIGVEREKSFLGKVVSGGKIVMDLNKLERLLDLIGQALEKKGK